jgi:glycosyltransferase involved in cell wall biosynthesis
VTDRLDVLWISMETPDRHGHGGQRRQYHLLRALVDAGLAVQVATLSSPQDPTSVQQLIPTSLLGPAPLRRPWAVSPYDRLVDELQPSRVVVAHLTSARLVPRTLLRRHPQVVIDVHNVDSRWHRALGERRAARAAARHESLVGRRAELVVCSEEERAALLRSAPHARTTIVRQGYDPAEWPDPSPDGRRTPPTIAFFGSLWYGVNLEGLRWFLAGAWPRIRAGRPDCELHLFGAGEGDDLHDPEHGVHVRGWVDRLAPAIREAAVVVVPLLAGPGSRVKFPEALASGVPVVATGVAAESFDAEGCYLQADDPESFADACLHLLSDAAGARSMANTARRHAMTTLTWAQVGRPLAELLAGSGGRRP